MIIFRRFGFEAAHRLPNVPPGHKCGNMHGHSYKVIIAVEGDVDPETGFVIDFGDIKSVVNPVVNELDHSTLNSLIPNPTAENLAIWIEKHIFLPGLTYIEVWETETSGVRHVVLLPTD